MHVPSLAVAQRCIHVTRALAPQIGPSLVHVLLSALLRCYLHPSVTSFDFTAQLLLALLELLRNSQASEVKMYPQLFWGCFALLQTVHVPIFSLVLAVLDALLSRLQLWNLPCQQIIQAGACAPHVDGPVPAGAPPPVLNAVVHSRSSGLITAGVAHNSYDGHTVPHSTWLKRAWTSAVAVFLLFCGRFSHSVQVC